MSSAALASQLTRRRLYAVGEAGAPRYAWGQGADPLKVYLDGQGRRWVQNPLMGNEWQRIHIMTATHPGNNLWGISGHYYADGPSHARMMAIYNVPQNKKMQGSDPSKGLHPGDEIMIPGLAPPTFQTPPAAPLPGAPAPGGEAPLPTAQAPQQQAPQSPLDWLAGNLPPGYALPGLPAAETPPGQPPPPPPPAPEQPPGLPPGIPAGLPGLVLTSDTAPAAAEQKAEEEKFWTTGKIVGAAAAGIGVVGLVVVGVMMASKKKRRRRG